jgi:alcohol dehydrogenase (cytochrome c)
MGLGGRPASGVGNFGNFVTAIDPKTGRIAWRHPLHGGSATGMLTTAGGLLFAGDGSGNLVAFDANTGTPLWNARLGNVTNAPQTYLLDGKQHVLVAAGDMLYAFRLN